MADDKNKEQGKSTYEKDREADTTVTEREAAAPGARTEVETGVFPYGQPDEAGFIGVDPIYANYANDVDKPYNEDRNDDGSLKEEEQDEGKHAKARSTRAATATTRADREGADDPGAKKD